MHNREGMRATWLRPLFVLFWALVAPFAMAQDPDAGLQVETYLDDGMLTVVPSVQLDRPARLRYEVSSSRSGTAGQSRTSQSGVVTAEAGKRQTLSTLRLSLGPTDRYAISIRVFEGDKLLEEKVFHFPE